MNVIFTTNKLDALNTEVVVVLFRQSGTNAAFQELDQRIGGALSQTAKQEKFKGQDERTLIWQGEVYGRSRKIVVVGLGRSEREPARFRLAVARAVRHAAAHRVQKMVVVVDHPEGEGQVEAVRLSAESAILSTYRFTKYKNSKPRDEGFPKTCQVTVFPSARNSRRCARALREGVIAAKATALARDLVNEPANLLSPDALGKRARAIAKQHGLDCTVLGEREIQRRGMNLLLSVAAGSERRPKFIHLTYTPDKSTRKSIALVGKGITFDTGGLCLKQGKSMYGMKTDMAGAATVLGVMSTLKDLAVPWNVHGIIPATDNSVGGDSTRPGDVFKALSGKTVEVVNTDAEGRLILADALTYACELRPNLIVDHATLTGACEVALGSYSAGLFAKRDEDAARYIKAAERAGELMWRLPLSKELESGIKSDVADIKNAGPRWGGAITAALFLKHFTAKIPWIHLDIAGPARADKNTPLYPKGGTGFGVLTALAFLSGR